MKSNSTEAWKIVQGNYGGSLLKISQRMQEFDKKAIDEMWDNVNINTIRVITERNGLPCSRISGDLHPIL
jgi:hypothetical protein